MMKEKLAEIKSSSRNLMPQDKHYLSEIPGGRVVV